MRSQHHRRSLAYSDVTALTANWPRRSIPEVRPYKVITVHTWLPRSVANQARREIYSYPFTRQRQLARRALRLSILAHGHGRFLAEPFDPVRVRIRVPSVLPLAAPSKVELRRGRINIASASNLRRAMDRLELNRRRYSEMKGNRRRARHGQLDSPGANAFGVVANAYRQGFGVRRIADAALVARAIGGF